MTIINIVAAPCAGKSTLACKLFYELKKSHRNVEYVNEFAKTLIWEDRLEEINDQFYISRNQYNILKSVHGKVEHVICDSPLFMSLFYNSFNENNISNVEKTEKYILEKMKIFAKDSMYIFIKRDETLPYTVSGRIHDLEQSRVIEHEMIKLLDKHNIEYMVVNTGDQCDHVLDILK